MGEDKAKGIALSNAALLRSQIEVVLSRKNPAALSPRVRLGMPRLACGLPRMDGLLRGGLPDGSVVEFVGADCSGRTTMAMAYVAAVLQTGGVCAWIDVADALDPASVAANGVDLERLLWVRCGKHQPDSPDSPTPASGRNTASGQPAASGPSAAARQLPGTGSTGSLHPRSEGKDMPQAIGFLLQAGGGGGLHNARQGRRPGEARPGTPGAPNRPLAPQSGNTSGYRSEHREEQVNSDRLPPRRGDNLALVSRGQSSGGIPPDTNARCAEPAPRRVARMPSPRRLPGPDRPSHPASNSASNSASSDFPPAPGDLKSGNRGSGKPWTALDQALRAADLLLQGGGFSLIVLDLGSTAPEAAWRIPLATWFRFRATCERTRVSLVLLTQHPCARSSAELVVRMEPGAMNAEKTVMTGIGYSAVTERSRRQDAQAQAAQGQVVSIRKPPQPERPGHAEQRSEAGGWNSEAAWA